MQHPPGEFDQSRAYVQVREYSSPSGDYVLRVDPEARNGMHGAEYVMRRRDRVVWEKALSRTLWNAVVSDDGIVGGYGYSELGSSDDSVGSFHVLVIGQHGELLANDRTQRTLSHHMHTASDPKAESLILNRDLDRMFIRMKRDLNSSKSPLWVYQLSTGKRLVDWLPERPFEIEEGKELLYPGEIKPLIGAELMLVHWWHVAMGKPSEGPTREHSTFTLVDGAGSTQWSLILEDDHTVKHDRERSERRVREVRELGAIRSVDGDGEFTIWSVGKGQQVSFLAERGGQKWSVSELRRTAFVAPKKRDEQEPVELDLPVARVQLLSETKLRPTKRALQKSPVHNLKVFGFSDDGAIEFVRWDDDGDVLVRLNHDGGIVSESPLIKLQPRQWSTRWFDGPGGSWYALVDGEYSKRTKVFWVDVISGDTTLIETLETETIDAFAVRRDGGFFARTYDRAKEAVSLVSVESSGAVLWRIDLRDESDPDRIAISIDTMVAKPDGGLVVLGTGWGEEDSPPYSYTVPSDWYAGYQELTAKGAVLSLVVLNETWGVEVDFPGQITLDKEGNVLIPDAGRLWRTTLDGELLGGLHLTVADGSGLPFAKYAVGPDGAVWGATERAMYSVSSAGVPGRVVGNPYETGTLTSGWGASIDHLGRLFINDGDTELWHVFDSSGAELFVCPFPTSKGQSFNSSISVDSDGRIYIELDEEVPEHFVYSSIGRPMTSTKLHGSNLNGAVEFEPKGLNHWFAWGADLVCLDESNTAVQIVERRPDGLWWDNLGSIRFSASGLRMVVSDSGSDYSPAILALYDKSDSSAAALRLPEGLYGYGAVVSDDWLLFDCVDQVILYHFKTESFNTMDAPGSKRRDIWAFSPDETEIWAVNDEDLILRRYSLPE
ncbi:MAG: hypothetical protein GY762_07440 [Proteobacteria bacterium]|nr:hypothetical protein [Pseudomonadota bacterium]